MATNTTLSDDKRDGVHYPPNSNFIMNSQLGSNCSITQPFFPLMRFTNEKTSFNNRTKQAISAGFYDRFLINDSDNDMNKSNGLNSTNTFTIMDSRLRLGISTSTSSNFQVELASRRRKDAILRAAYLAIQMNRRVGI